MRGATVTGVWLVAVLTGGLGYPERQHLVGVLSMPYAEVNEPFEFWLSGSGEDASSRIDWYHGLDITIQRPDMGEYGTTYKFSYSTVTADDEFTCFTVPGQPDGPVTPDQMLPDLADFQNKGLVDLDGRQVHLLENQYLDGGRVNTYKFYYDTRDGEMVPVKYSMLGYDTLLHSHFDRYDVIYTSSDQSVNSSVFNLQSEYSCRAFPGPGVSAEDRIKHSHARLLFNKHAHASFKHAFQEFKQAFNKQYTDEDEERGRIYKYMHNLRFIHSKNRAGLSYKLAVNHLADTDEEDRKFLRGIERVDDGRTPNALTYDAEENPGIEIPDSWDWRMNGAVTQVKDQAVCGSCWSFGTTGTLEGSYFLKTGDLHRFSQQNIIDCSWRFGNNGCDGGEDWRAYEWIMHSGGLMTEAAYGHYLGQDGTCKFNQSQAILHIKSYSYVKGEDERTVKKALLEKGPLSITIDTTPGSKAFLFYHRGVYYNPDCGSKVADLDHAVVLVGWGRLDGQEYWLVKNSWSTYWGNLGYVTMAVRDNNCGVITQPSFATLQ